MCSPLEIIHRFMKIIYYAEGRKGHLISDNAVIQGIEIESKLIFEKFVFEKCKGKMSSFLILRSPFYKVISSFLFPPLF